MTPDDVTATDPPLAGAPPGTAARGVAHAGIGAQVTARTLRRRAPVSLGTLARHLLLLTGAFSMALPFVWMVLTAFKSGSEASTIPPTWLPARWRWENFRLAWEAAPFGRYFLVSLIQSSATSALTLATGIPAAFAFAQFRFRGRQLLFVLFLATMMLPAELSLIPNFVLVRQLGWYDSFLALIVPYAANPLSIFLLRQAFLGLPRELWETAQIDGAAPLWYMTRVAVPLIRPTIAVCGLLAFIGAWNALLWPLVATSSEDMRTVQVGLTAFTQDASTDFPLLMAASTLVVLPVVALFLIAQHQIIEGITHSGLRG